MKHTKSSPLSAEALLAEWHIFAALISALARSALRMRAKSPRAALQRLETLELWTAAALGKVTRQATALEDLFVENNAQERYAAFAQILLMLLLILQQLKRKFAAKIRRLPAAGFVSVKPVALPRSPMGRPAHIDDS